MRRAFLWALLVLLLLLLTAPPGRGSPQAIIQARIRVAGADTDLEFDVSGLELDGDGNVSINPAVLFALLGDSTTNLDLEPELARLGIVRRSGGAIVTAAAAAAAGLAATAGSAVPSDALLMLPPPAVGYARLLPTSAASPTAKRQRITPVRGMATGLTVQQTTWPAAPPFTNRFCPPLATAPDWSNSPDPASACNCGFVPCIVVSGPMEVYLGAELTKASCSLATRESNGYNSLDREPVPPALHPPSPTVKRSLALPHSCPSPA
jgi:hypothetical protein